jgi:hypothetical protein
MHPANEAVVPGKVTDTDLRALASDKRGLAPEARRQLDEAKARELAAASALSAQPLADAPPVSAARLDAQRRYLAAWQSQRQQIEVLPEDQRDAALLQLKQSIVGGGL